MLHSLKALDGFTIAASNGKLGRVTDIYFDDEKWTIRYFEVDTGWLVGRNVLVSPIAVSNIDWDHRTIHVKLSQQEVNDSPGIDTARPVSRQHEAALSDYYGYPFYWTGPYAWGYTALPLMLEPQPYEENLNPEAAAEQDQNSENDDDLHLRTKDEVVGYAIQATDDAVGHLEDFLFDDEDWSIQLMLIDTRNWWPGKHVLISPKLIIDMSWEEKSVLVNVSRNEIESSPQYDENHVPSREDIEHLYHRSNPQPSFSPGATGSTRQEQRRH